MAETAESEESESSEASGPDRPAGLFRGYAGRMLLLVVLGAGLQVAGRLVIPALLPTVIESFAITASGAGFALTVMVAMSAVCQYLGGRSSDRLSRKTVLVAALGLFILGFAVLAAAPVFGAFLVGALLIGSAQGLYFPASIALLSDLYTERRGQAFGINNASFALGSAIAPAIAVATLTVAPWRAAFVPVAVLLTVVLLLMHHWNREPYVVARVGLDVRRTATRLVGAPTIRRSLLAFGLAGFVWQGGVNFIPTFLQVERGFSQPLASAAFSGLFVVGMVATPLAGNLGDRLGYTSVAGGSVVLAMVGLGMLVAVPGVPTAVAGALLFGGGISAFWPVMNAYVMERFPPGSMGGDFGAINTVALGVGSLGPSFVGLVAERASYTAAFVGLLACLVVAVAAVVRVARTPE